MTDSWAGCQGPKEKLFQKTNKKPKTPAGVKFNSQFSLPQEAHPPPWTGDYLTTSSTLPDSLPQAVEPGQLSLKQMLLSLYTILDEVLPSQIDFHT